MQHTENDLKLIINIWRKIREAITFIKQELAVKKQTNQTL